MFFPPLPFSPIPTAPSLRDKASEVSWKRRLFTLLLKAFKSGSRSAGSDSRGSEAAICSQATTWLPSSFVGGRLISMKASSSNEAHGATCACTTTCPLGAHCSLMSGMHVFVDHHIGLYVGKSLF